MTTPRAEVTCLADTPGPSPRAVNLGEGVRGWSHVLRAAWWPCSGGPPAAAVVSLSGRVHGVRNRASGRAGVITYRARRETFITRRWR